MASLLRFSFELFTISPQAVSRTTSALNEQPLARHLVSAVVDHHSALSDPARTAARLNAFLGGTFEEGTMSKAVDRALRR
jgi:hypothetical protein